VPTLGEIEDAILARLAPLKGTHGVRTLDSYDTRLEDPEAWKRFGIQFPAVFVAYEGFDNVDKGSRQVAMHRYQIGVADQALRWKEARRGAVGNGGAYALIDGVRDILAGVCVLPRLLPAMPKGGKVAFVRTDASMYVLTYSIGEPYLIP